MPLRTSYWKTARFLHLDPPSSVQVSQKVTLVSRGSHKTIKGAFRSNIAPPQASIQVATAIELVERAFPGAYNGHPTKLEYYAQPDGSVVLVHVIQVQGHDTWFQVYVDAHSGQVVSSTNFRSDFQQPGVSMLFLGSLDFIEFPSSIVCRCAYREAKHRRGATQHFHW